MEENIVKHKKELEHIFKEKLRPVLIKKILDHDAFINDLSRLQNDLIAAQFNHEDKTKALSNFKGYKQELSTLVSSYFAQKDIDNSEKIFRDYEIALDEFLDTIDVYIKRTQDRERFYTTPTDNKSLAFRKKIKRGFFKISKIPLRFFNIFRKNKKPILFWDHNIPYKNITDHYFRNGIIEHLIPVISSIYKEISEITNTYWITDTIIDEEIKNYLNTDKPFDVSENANNLLAKTSPVTQRIEHLDKVLDQIFESIVSGYKEALLKSNTIELSASKFDSDVLHEKNEKIAQKIFKNEYLWANTYKVLKDDWDLDTEIYILIFTILSNYNDSLEKINYRATLIKKQLDSIITYFLTADTKIKDISDHKLLKKTIVEEIKNIDHKLNAIPVAETISVITSQDIPSVINEFEVKMLQLLTDISKKRAISTDNNYTSQTLSSAINYTSPNELINYESWPLFSKKINTIKVDITVKLDEVIDTINELGQVTEFNLESALTLFDLPLSTSDPKTIAIEGYQRNLNKIKDVSEMLSSFDETVHKALYPEIKDFNKRIVELTETENIYNIKLTIAKAKSVEKSKAIRSKVTNTVKNFIPIAVTTVLCIWTKGKGTIRGVLLRTGLYKNSGVITEDVYDFLKEADHALDKLPFIYQRLFRSETLNNEDLFVGRDHALTTLNIAFETWKKERFSTVIISGERGAGKTSLIHYFINSVQKGTKTLILSPVHTTYTPMQLFDFLNNFFSKQLFTIQDWADYLNASGKKIIVLENIQYLYYRKINGFEALHLISELIYLTHKSVFWVFTCSKYTYQYLDKSIQISEQFSSHIEMDDIDQDTMTNALTKRHKMSGYDLFFEEPPKEYLSKKFLKSSAEDKQKMLKDEFYKDINKIAKSNFKIAFMYWLRSTTDVRESMIHMRSLKNIDLSFLEKLAPVKLFVLNTILLHEKLKTKDIITITRLEAKEVRRIMNALYETGLLILDDEQYYNINTLLYRQIVTLLKSKNFIHE